MDIVQRMNRGIAYFESKLEGETIDFQEVAKLTYITSDSFQRFFCQLSGISAHEYIRRRRLTEAALELRRGGGRIIDIAMKYGYDSADAFSRAFKAQHGIAPNRARSGESALALYLPISFHIAVKGVERLMVRIADVSEMTLYGIEKEFEGAAFERWEQEHMMWADHHDSVQTRVSPSVPGIWYGIWDGGRYAIAREAGETTGEGMVKCIVKPGKYAVFQSDCGGFAGDVLPKLRERIFDEWLPNSEYAVTGGYEIEVYHLYDKHEKHKRYYEFWIPVIIKNSPSMA